jgi:hypothetical protein
MQQFPLWVRQYNIVLEIWHNTYRQKGLQACTGQWYNIDCQEEIRLDLVIDTIPIDKKELQP